MNITLELLRQHHACDEHANRFAELWPDGAEVTLENLRFARETGLPVAWLTHVMTAQQYQTYAARINSAWFTFIDDYYDTQSSHDKRAAAQHDYYNAVDAVLVTVFASE